MALDTDVLKAVKAEIEKDPTNRGYNGKNITEIVDLINNPRITIEDIVYHDPPPPPKDGDIIGEKRTVEEARVAAILIGIPKSPNILTDKDISDALNLVL